MLSGSFFVICALLATVVSVAGLTVFAAKAYDPKHRRTLSEMATTSPGRMVAFRAILVPCSLLFLVALAFFVAPESKTSASVVLAALAMCLSEIVLAIIPATPGWRGVTHNFLGYLMGVAMYMLVALFWLALSGGWRMTEGLIALAMAALFFGTLLDRKRFIFYELPYIYLSHVSIVVVALALARPLFD